MYICTVVYNRTIELPNCVLFVNDISKAIPNLPILIIGSKETIKIFGEDRVKFLNRVIDEEKSIYWTFSPFEKRILMEKDIENFIKLSVNNIIKDVKYYYINVLTMNKVSLKKMIKILRIDSKIKNISIVNKFNFLYIYVGKNILGVDLGLLKYFERKSLDINKIKKKILKNKSNVLCDIEDSLEEYKEIIKHINGDVKLLPYFNCINEENLNRGEVL